MRILLVVGGFRALGAFLSFFLALSLSTSALTACSEQHADTTGPNLDNTFESPEAVSRAVLATLEAKDYEKLRSFALSDEEFRLVVWPELPASRPGRNVPLAYAWGNLNQKSTNCLRRLVMARGGRRYELIRVEFEGQTTFYETFKVHRDGRLAIQDDQGNVERVNFFGSIIERGGRYKLFSYNID